jgi:hypothetical protein
VAPSADPSNENSTEAVGDPAAASLAYVVDVARLAGDVVGRPVEPLADSKRSPAWRATRFGPAFTAIHDPTVKLTDPRWWVTETPERLAQSAALLGVHPALPVPVADAIAFRLEIPRLVLRQAADEYARARGRADRGQVLVGVLAQLGADACLLDRVLAAGACAGCWGTVTRWEVATWGARGRVFAGRGASAG